MTTPQLSSMRTPAAAGPWSASPARELPTEARLEAVWARHDDEVRAAQALRWRVFAEEMGARLNPLPGSAPGLDVDLFDAHCEHLLVRTVASDDTPARVVGTYRVLTPGAARVAGGLYSETEFDLVRLRHLRPRMAELGRSCTDPQWRTGGVILTLWSSLGQFLQRNALDCVVGCASVTLRDGGTLASNLWHQLRKTHLAPPELHVRPRLPLPVEPPASAHPVEPPPLIKGYLRCGGRVLGPPSWAPDFGTADLPMMLRLADLPETYRRRFLSA